MVATDGIEKAKAGFSKAFGEEATLGASAPGRVNIIGEHIDYCDGFVLPMALEHRTTVVAKPTGNNIVTFASSESDDKVSFELTEANLAPTHGKVEPYWENYLRGVCAQFPQNKQGFNAYLTSNVPVGGGLSSSAALEVAIYTLLEKLTGESRTLVQKSQDCQKAENDWANVPCGIMDQSISAMGQAGHLLLLDCQSMETRHVEMKNHDVCFVITNSNVKHSLTGSEYPTRRKQTVDVLNAVKAKFPEVKSFRDIDGMDKIDAIKGDVDEETYNRGRHVIGEIARTLAFAKDLEANDLKAAGQLMYDSHWSLSKDFEVSTEELDNLVEIAAKVKGVYGSRMTGGGFGGCTVTLVDKSRADDLIKAIEAQYKMGTPTCFSSEAETGKDIRQFLGAMNYLREHLPEYGKIAGPLYELQNVKILKNDETWRERGLDAFIKLKELLHSPETLQQPLEDVKYELETDASKYGFGGCLFQTCPKSGKKRIIQLFSGAFKKAQKDYSIPKKELFAIVFAMKHLKYYLLGRKFEIYCDNQSVCYMHTNDLEKSVIGQWFETIGRFSFNITHVPRENNQLADHMSKMCPDAVVRNWQTKGKVECKNILNKDLMIKEKHIASLSLPSEYREKVDKYNDKQKTFRYGTCDWKLQDEYFNIAEDTYGPHTVDSFAAKHNAQLERYMDATSNAFNLDWAKENIWANPPWHLIDQVIDHVKETGATITLCSPLYFHAKWHTKWKNMLVDTPIVLPRKKDTFLRYGKQVVGETPWRYTTISRISGDKSKCREIDDCFWANLQERSEASLKSLRVQGTVNQTDRVLQNLDQNLTTSINKENIIEGGRKRRKIDYNDHVYEKVLKDTMEKDIFEITQRHQLLTKQGVKEFVDRNPKLVPEISREKNNLVVTDTLNNTNGQKGGIDVLSTSTVGDSVPTEIIVRGENNNENRESSNFSNTQETIISDKQNVQENDATNIIENTDVIINNTNLVDETPVVENCGVHNSGVANELLEEPHQAEPNITVYTDIEGSRVDGEPPGEYTLAEKLEIIQQTHNLTHSNVRDLYTILRHGGHYEWKDLMKLVRQIDSLCNHCELNQVGKRGFHPLKSIRGQYPGDIWEIDLMVLPRKQSKDEKAYILHVLDVFSGFNILRRVEDKSSREIAETLHKIMCDHGMPRKILHDKGNEFLNTNVKEIFGILGNIVLDGGAPYHPQVQGANERRHREIRNLIKDLLKDVYDDWDSCLPTVQMKMNMRIYRKHKSTPFSVYYGRLHNLHNFNRNAHCDEQTWFERLDDIYARVYPGILHLSNSYYDGTERIFDKKNADKQLQFSEGSWVKMLNVNSNGTNLDDKWKGPYIISSRVHGGYNLVDANSSTGGLVNTHPVPIGQLSAWTRLDRVQDERKACDYVKILDDGKLNNRTMYKVLWDDATITWEFASSFTDSSPILKYRQQKLAATKKAKPKVVKKTISKVKSKRKPKGKK